MDQDNSENKGAVQPGSQPALEPDTGEEAIWQAQAQARQAVQQALGEMSHAPHHEVHANTGQPPGMSVGAPVQDPGNQLEALLHDFENLVERLRSLVNAQARYTSQLTDQDQNR